MKDVPYRANRTSGKQAAQAKVLSLIASGLSVSEAVGQAGRSVRAYEEWRKNSPGFASKVDRLRAEGVARPAQGGAGKFSRPGGVPFPLFRQTFFDNATPDHHWRMVEALESTNAGEICLVLAFPEAAKTTLLTDRICWLLGDQDPDHRICVISEGRDLAAKVLRHVQLRMTDAHQFGAFVERYGPFRAEDREFSKPWNAGYMSILSAHNDEKEPSLEARGAGSKLYGGRYDWMALDDIQSSESLNATPGLLTYIRQTVLTRLVLGRGRTSIWGSRVGDGDIYERLIEEDMVDRLVKIPALTQNIPKDEHYVVKMPGRKIVVNPNCPAQPTWDRFTLKQLAVRREQVKESIWARTYMQQALDTFGATFTDEMLDSAKDARRGVGQRAGVGMLCSVDPALESGTCAYVACAYDAERLWVVDAHTARDTFRTEDILDRIASWSARYRPQSWIIEQNNFQKALVRDDRLMSLAAKFRFEVVPHQTSRNKYDPVIGITMMPSSFVDREIVIPWDEGAREKMGPLVEELRSWRPKRSGRDLKQDLVVALWFCWIRWQAERDGLTAQLPRFKRPSWMLKPA